ncbi:MAG: hypothetical protein ACM3JK_04825 [Betaproteobacteria bacterium]
MAEQKSEIILLLAPDNIEAQCLEAIKQARNASHALAALIALQSFISATIRPSDRFTPAHEAVKAVVDKHAAEIRIRILAEHAEALAEAIRQRNRPEIARIHTALSRNGFWQAAQQAMQQLGEDELATAAEWAKGWCRSAKSSAQSASGFPEALDFRKAGISTTEYAAMTDVGNYLAN